jgi:multisubunit Na+/H+ antiporter MnhE subunit
MDQKDVAPRWTKIIGLIMMIVIILAMVRGFSIAFQLTAKSIKPAIVHQLVNQLNQMTILIAVLSISLLIGTVYYGCKAKNIAINAENRNQG